MSENVILSFGRLVTGEAGFVQYLVAGFSVLKVSEPPAARRGVLFLVLDHKLNIYGGSSNGRLEAGARKAAG